jgi:hypothetical protein
MVRHRTFDPLASVKERRWLVMQTVFHRRLSSREIPPGADLRQVMVEAATRMRADGWHPESDGSRGFFFAHRGTERVEVGLEHVAPGQAGPSRRGVVAARA